MKRFSLFVIALLSIVTMVASVSVARAASLNDNVDCSGEAGNSSFCTETSQVKQNPIFGKDGILTRGGGLLALVTGIVSVFMMIYAGLKFVLSSGDAGKITTARNTILFASVGLVIAISTQAIVVFILKKL